MTVQDARRLLDSLKAKETTLKARRVEIGKERESLAFGAIAEGDEAAADRVQSLNQENMLLGEQLVDLGSAIAEAERRLAAADAEEKRAHELAKADQVEAFAMEFECRAAALDRAIALVQEEWKGLTDVQFQMYRLGCNTPSGTQLTTMGRRALEAGLRGLPLEVQTQAPHERHTFGDLARSWGQSIARWCAERRAPARKEAA
jgi:hypothetical protein